MLHRLLLVALLASPAALAQGSPAWESRVHYEMDIRLLADRHGLRGTQQLTYENASPDTLTHVFYHLYFNAFQPGSMMAERNRHLPDPDGRVVPRIFELGPDEIGYHRVHALEQDGTSIPFEVNDTVLKARLARPIPPGGTAVFDMAFESQVPLQTRRSGRDSRGDSIDFSMTQWYPKLAMYDERGWHADPYVGREFYAPFGTFEVAITAPAEYVIGASGLLQNADEVGYGYEDGPPQPYETYRAGRDSLTWQFRAERVHDFAWAADPDYIHDLVELEDGLTFHVLYTPEVAETWSQLLPYLPPMVEYMDEHFGPYPYPQFTVIQGGDGGMEYPMITLISGHTGQNYDRVKSLGSVLGTTVHEFAHMWYYGILASNEADYAWMDEGFVSYATAETMAFLQGQEGASHLGSMLSVMALHDAGLFEPFDTPADWFRTNRAYGTSAYSGGRMIVDMLGYVMSDSLRDRFLLEYYDEYKFRHPNPYDVERVAEAVSGMRLDWYFWQFLNSDWTLDYAIEDLASVPSGGGFRTSLELERHGEAVLPMDVRLTMDDGSELWVNVPLLVMQAHKPVPPEWVVAEPWPWTFPEYELVIETPRRVVEATLDPRLRTPDMNRLNNTTGFPIEAEFLQPVPTSLTAYGVGWRPLGQYAEDFGFGGGLRAEGAAFWGRHRADAMVKLWPQVIFSGGEEPENALFGPDADVSFFDGIDYALRYENEWDALGRDAAWSFAATKHLGFLENTLGLEKRFGGLLQPGPHRLRLGLVHHYNPTDRAFILDGFDWFSDVHLLSARASYRVGGATDHVALGVELGVALRNTFRCTTAVGLEGPCEFPAPEFTRPSATHATLRGAKTVGLGALTARATFLAGLGVDNLAFYKRFRLGAATVENAWRNDASRTALAAFADPLDNLADTGLSLATVGTSGPVAYLLPGEVEGVLGNTPQGPNVLAGRLSLLTPTLGAGWLAPLHAEAYSGVGQTWFSGTVSDGQARFQDLTFDADRFLADAGIAVHYDVGALAALQRWVDQSDVLRQLRLSAYAPLWVSDPDRLGPDEDAVGLRWLLGIRVAP